MIQIEQLNVTALLEENTYLKKQVVYYQETTEQLQKEYTYLRGKIEEIEQEQEEIIADQVSRECAHLRNKVEQLGTRLTWRSNVDRIPGDVLTPSRKATIIKLRTYLKEHAACADSEGYQQVFLENLTGEQEIGALGDNINYVSTVHPQDKSGQYRLDIPAVIPLFEKRLIWVQDGPKKWHQEASIKALPLLEDPTLWAYACTSIIQHGGLRPGAGRPKKCERCGHDLEEKNTVTRKQRSTHCPKCGIDHVYPEAIVSEPLTPTDPLPPDGGGLKNQLDFSISEEDETSENQLDLDYLDTRGQVDFSTSQEETSENQLDFQSPIQATVDTVGGIPQELRARRLWVCWRYQDGKKVPYIAQSMRHQQEAKVNNPATWRTCDQAVNLYEQSRREGWKHPFDGIGFMCDGSFVGIDLDHCRNKETGEIAAWAQAILDRFASYWYITPSGEGVRIIIHAKKPGPLCKKGDKEIYEEKRFFTWTPMQVPGTPETIADRQDELTAFYAETFPKQDASKEVRHTPTVFTLPHPCTDEQVLEKARGATNGAKFTRLWEGDTTGYASPSNADLALCRMLAYWTDGDSMAVDRLFRQSKLYRPEKWDRPARAGETYGEGTIRYALREEAA